MQNHFTADFKSAGYDGAGHINDALRIWTQIMLKILGKITNSLVYQLIFTVGMTLLVSVSTWAYFNIDYQKKNVMDSIVEGTDKLSSTIRLGTHYSMMLNSRDDINQIIVNIGKQEEIRYIRIYNKSGQIKFSNRAEEVDRMTNIKAEACDICHRSDPPAVKLDISRRIRIFDDHEGYRLLGIISPIYNEPGCSADSCHVHPQGKKILGALDVVVSLEKTDRETLVFEEGIIILAMSVFVMSSAVIFIFVLKFVNHPIKKLIEGTKRISRGDYSEKVLIPQNSELEELAAAVNQMGKEIGQKQAELNRKKNEYQNLFELVPCIITVQDRNYRLIRYNRQFAEKFDPKPGDYCFCAYKGRKKKCLVCPVEKTFEDGTSHYSEESGIDKDGEQKYWIVKTSPLKDEKGNIIAAMEMCIDITHRKMLEEELEKSEKKYYAIFNNIPNPVFVLDTETFQILDCNESMRTVYGYAYREMMNRSFLDLFKPEDREHYAGEIKIAAVISQAKQVSKDGRTMFANIRISPTEYLGQKVLLVTTSDITKRLEAEQQLHHASKMATLGEMATGVAHELNQPLTVINTASSFLMRKMNQMGIEDDDPIYTMTQKIGKSVDRAAKIINHMRQFARKSDMKSEKTEISTVLEKAVDMFSQQLKIRGIEIVYDIQKDIPPIMADPDRLEQVFVNLLINARDAIETKYKTEKTGEKKIILKTISENGSVTVEISDTGTGIPDAIADKIFEPFFTTKEVGKGTGIGLSISYGIVKDFGGDIRAIPGRKEGACFVIKFPEARIQSEP